MPKIAVEERELYLRYWKKGLGNLLWEKPFRRKTGGEGTLPRESPSLPLLGGRKSPEGKGWNPNPFHTLWGLGGKIPPPQKGGGGPPRGALNPFRVDTRGRLRG